LLRVHKYIQDKESIRNILLTAFIHNFPILQWRHLINQSQISQNSIFY